MRHKPAPFLKVGRAAEIDRVVLDRRPFDEQPVAQRFFDRALQFHALAALGALEYRRGVLHAGLEFRFHARFDVDLRNFENHGPSLGFAAAMRGGSLARSRARSRRYRLPAPPLKPQPLLSYSGLNWEDGRAADTYLLLAAGASGRDLEALSSSRQIRSAFASPRIHQKALS
jgi:hypothetical protein